MARRFFIWSFIQTSGIYIDNECLIAFNYVIHMLVTIAAVLVILWLLGIVTAYTLGGFIHILLVIAIIMVLVRVIQGKPIL